MPPPTYLSLSLAILLGACAPTTWTLDIKPSVEDPSAVRGDVAEALDWFCRERGLDPADFYAGIHIRVFADYWHCWEERTKDSVTKMCYAGMYWFQARELWVVWHGGPGDNELFHELLHVELRAFESHWDYGMDRSQKIHTKAFLDEARLLRQLWKIDHEKR